MEAPICERDMKRDSLCRECEQALSEGKISELDVRVSRALQKLSKQFYFVNAEFKKSLDLGDMVVLLCKGNIGSLIGKKGRVVSELGKVLEKKVRVIELVKDDKKMIQDFVGNARVLSVNKVFRIDGKEHKVIIAEQDRERLATSPQVLKAGIEKMLDTQATIIFR